MILYNNKLKKSKHYLQFCISRTFIFKFPCVFQEKLNEKLGKFEKAEKTQAQKEAMFGDQIYNGERLLLFVLSVAYRIKVNIN